MASLLCPYVNFNGQAREALEFYESVFGGTLTMSTFSEFGVTDGVDPDGVMHGQLETPAGYTVMASDVPPGMPAVSGGSITLSLAGDDTEALRGYFAALAEGGTVSVPLAVQMWGDEFGQLTDRFGVGWLANIAVPKG